MKITRLVRNTIFGFFLTLFITSFSVQWSNPISFQENLRLRWEKYILYPTSDNAKEIISVLSNHQYIGKIDEATIEMIFNSLDLVDNGINAKDRNAIRLAIKLIDISDGAFTEILFHTIGKLIKVDATLFLEEITKSKIINDQFILAGILVGFSQSFVDKNYLKIEEIKLRIEAFKKVNKNELDVHKKRSLDILNDRLVMFLKIKDSLPTSVK